MNGTIGAYPLSLLIALTITHILPTEESVLANDEKQAIETTISQNTQTRSSKNDGPVSEQESPRSSCDGTVVVPALVTVQTSGPEQFVIRVTDQVLLDEMIDICKGYSMQRIVVGRLVTGNGGYNHDALNANAWSWHLQEDTISLADMTMEVCDGLPSFVENYLGYWVGFVHTYCPWTSNIVAIAEDDSVNGDIDVDHDVDLDDYLRLSECLQGPEADCFSSYYCDGDLDGDNDIDLVDFSIFQQVFTSS